MVAEKFEGAFDHADEGLALLRCMSPEVALRGRIGASALRPLLGLFQTTNARCEYFAD
jgi:hypothetical protein